MTFSEDWICEQADAIRAARRDPIDRRMFDREVARVRDPKAFAIEQRRIEQLRQLRAEADGPKVLCAHCGASVGWPVPDKCKQCGVEIKPDDSDDSMFDPARLGETVPKV